MERGHQSGSLSPQESLGNTLGAAGGLLGFLHHFTWQLEKELCSLYDSVHGKF